MPRLPLPPARAAIAAAAVVLAAAASVSSSSAAAAASFAPQQSLGTTYFDPQVSFFPQLLADGSAAFAYVRSTLEGPSPVVLATRAPGEPFGPIRTLSGGGAEEIALAAAPDARRGVLAWSVAGGAATSVDLGPGGATGSPVAAARRVAWLSAWIDGRGDVLVRVSGLLDDTARFAVRRAGTSTFGRERTLGDAIAPRVIATESGFVAVWTQATSCRRPGPDEPLCWRWTLRGAVALRGQPFGAPQTLGPARPHGPLRLLPRGDDGVLVVWRAGSTPRLHGATLAAGATRFAPARAISRAGRAATEPEVAVAGRGDGLVVWEERPPAARRGRAARSGPVRVVAARLAPSGRFGTPFTLSGRATQARAPRARVNDRGDALIAWSNGSRWSVRTRPAGGRFGPASALEPVERPWLARLALDADGAATALYARGPQVAVAEWQAGAVPSARTLEADGVNGRPTLATNARGQAVAVWRHAQEEGAVQQVRVATRESRGRFGVPVTVGEAGRDDPAAQLNDRGDVLLAWYVNGDEAYELSAVLGRLGRP